MFLGKSGENEVGLRDREEGKMGLRAGGTTPDPSRADGYN